MSQTASDFQVNAFFDVLFVTGSELSWLIVNLNSNSVRNAVRWENGGVCVCGRGWGVGWGVGVGVGMGVGGGGGALKVVIRR